jgi:hypothetical protein
MRLLVCSESAMLLLLTRNHHLVWRRCLYVDEHNQLLLVATADKCAHVFDLSAGFVPLARYEAARLYCLM